MIENSTTANGAQLLDIAKLATAHKKKFPKIPEKIDVTAIPVSVYKDDDDATCPVVIYITRAANAAIPDLEKSVNDSKKGMYRTTNFNYTAQAFDSYMSLWMQNLDANKDLIVSTIAQWAEK